MRTATIQPTSLKGCSTYHYPSRKVQTKMNTKLAPTNSTLSFLPSFLFYILSIMMGDIETATVHLYNGLTLMARGGFGHGGVGSAASHAKGLLLVIIMILLIPAVALIFTGGTTNSTGVYTNATIANNSRNGIAQFSQFIGIAMILGVVGVIISLV